MNKKSLLGIIAILMVIALALTGCGQQGEQNAGATGSESQNGTVDEGNSSANEDEVTAEPEEPDVAENGVDNRHPEMRDGYYVYEVLGEEFLCETNIWDFIDEEEKTFNFGEMRGSLGLDPYLYVGKYVLITPYCAISTPTAVLRYDVCAFTDESRTEIDHSAEKIYSIRYDQDANVQAQYAASDDDRYLFTIDLIVLAAYACEQIKQDLTSPPLGDHLLEYYDEETTYYVLP
ncbi:MAG: hypothetical protein ACI3W5_08630 [Faecousia sp.]